MGTIGVGIGLLWGNYCNCILYLVEGNLWGVVVLLECGVFNISNFGIYSL